MKISMKQSLTKLHKGCLIAAVIHWMLTFFTDHIIFDYVMWDMSNMTQIVKTAMTYGAKAVFLLVLIGIYQGAYYLFVKADKRFLRYTLIYFGANMALLLLTWPGIWRMDEFGILNSAVLLLPVFWQNYLTSLFYVFSMMLIPIPAGVIVVQCIINSLVVGYLVNAVVKKYGKWGLLAYVPFFFLPVLDSNLYPMRMCVYGFLELLLLVLLYERYCKNNLQGTDEDAKETGHSGFMGICILAALVTVWRTEAIYYFVLFPLLFIILFCKSYDKKKIITTVIIYLACSLCLFVPQMVGDKLTSGNQYDLTSVVLPMVPLVEEAYESGQCEEELAQIDRVINVKLAVQGAKEGRSGISLFWSEPDFQRIYTDVEYQEFKRAYYQLIFKYPATFLKERWNCFTESADLLENTTELFSKDGVVNYEKFRSYPLSRPINDELRSNVIKWMEWREMEDYNLKRAGYSLIYNSIIPICILLAAWLCCLVKRKWSLFFTISLPMVKVPLIFLTAPSRLFMYYYSLYLMGYFLLTYVLIKGLASIWARAGASIQKTMNYAKRNGIKAAFVAVLERLDKKHRDSVSEKAASYKGCKDWSVDLSEEELQKEIKAQQTATFTYEPFISIVVPTYETDATFLKELLYSVQNQTYTRWELVLADASATDSVKHVLLNHCAPNPIVYEENEAQGVHENNPKSGIIRYIRLEENKGISENTNVAIEKARGDYIALLDHDDVLTFDALYFMVEKLNEKKALAVYSDEDKCDGALQRFYEPHFKPDFNLDLLLSNNYICHFLMVEASAMKELRLRKAYDGAQDYDLILRLAIKAMGEEKAFLHVPKVLYHWRCHEGSTAGNTESKRYAYDAGRNALEAYFEAMNMGAQVTVTDSRHLGFYKVTYEPDIFAVRSDVAAICGRIVQKGIILNAPYQGTRCIFSGYMHRASLYMDINPDEIALDEIGEAAIKIRPNLSSSLKEALAQGMKLVYDPEFIVFV